MTRESRSLPAEGQPPPNSVAALAHLGELTGALMGTTIMAKSLFDSSARNIGVVGTFSSPSTRDFLAGTDVVIAAGASLNPFTTQKGALFPGAVVIQIDVDDGALGRYTTPNVPIHADVRSGAAELAAELERRGFHGRGRDQAGVAARSPVPTAKATVLTSDGSDALDPYESDAPTRSHPPEGAHRRRRCRSSADVRLRRSFGAGAGRVPLCHRVPVHRHCAGHGDRRRHREAGSPHRRLPG